MTGNKEMPDFDSLSDRLIAQASPSPSIVIKTNLDPKNVTEDNPYHGLDDLSIEDEEKFNQYFRKS